jgi:hypothetical protein
VKTFLTASARPQYDSDEYSLAADAVPAEPPAADPAARFVGQPDGWAAEFRIISASALSSIDA